MANPIEVNENSIIALTNSLDYHLGLLKDSLDKLETTSAIFLKSRVAEGDCKAGSLCAAPTQNRSRIALVLDDLITKTIQLNENVEAFTRRVDV